MDDVGLEVERGSVFGIIGPNDAGKTTAIECLEALRQPDGGSVLVAGPDPTADRVRLVHKIGVQLQVAGIPPHMKAWEALRLFAALYETSIPFSELSGELGLDGTLSRQHGSLLGAQKPVWWCDKRGVRTRNEEREQRAGHASVIPAGAGREGGNGGRSIRRVEVEPVRGGAGRRLLLGGQRQSAHAQGGDITAGSRAALGEEFPEAHQSGRHGNRQEELQLRTATALNDHLEWPEAGQVCCLERTRTVKGIRPVERSYAVTSLPRVDRGSPPRAGLTQVSVGR